MTPLRLRGRGVAQRVEGRAAATMTFVPRPAKARAAIRRISLEPQPRTMFDSGTRCKAPSLSAARPLPPRDTCEDARRRVAHRRHDRRRRSSGVLVPVQPDGDRAGAARPLESRPSMRARATAPRARDGGAAPIAAAAFFERSPWASLHDSASQFDRVRPSASDAGDRPTLYVPGFVCFFVSPSASRSRTPRDGVKLAVADFGSALTESCHVDREALERGDGHGVRRRIPVLDASCWPASPRSRSRRTITLTTSVTSTRGDRTARRR